MGRISKEIMKRKKGKKRRQIMVTESNGSRFNVQVIGKVLN